MPPRDQLEGGSDTPCFTRVQYFVWDPGVPCRGAISSRTYPSCALPATGGGSVHVLTQVFHTLVRLKCACPLLFFTPAQVPVHYLQDTQGTHLRPHLWSFLSTCKDLPPLSVLRISPSTCFQPSCRLCCWTRSGFLVFTPNPWCDFLLSLQYASSFYLSTDKQPEGISQLIYSLYRCTHRIFVLHLFPCLPSSSLFPKHWLPQ